MDIPRQRTLLISLITLFLLLISSTSMALVQYVSDELVINMRSGKGNGFKIIKIVKSGTPLTVLEKDAGYTRARTPQGVEGWVLSRFLIKTPVARTLLSKAQSDVAQMKEKYDAMEGKLKTITVERDTLSSSEKQLLDYKEKLNVELTKLKKIAARPMQLEAENDQLRNDLVKIEAENRILKQEYQTLEDNSDQEWFMTGAGVLFGGMILGLIFPKLRSGQKKANWNRL
ncbi:TIGR04211 family SH3 domain-containing protein [sulfur-oxidizing endosymbiont of Gigantopelta aegis]|uniref:TIGR04211 family SH3 domain-containing protein n=1 Tax=sulfur-oxidizing endosymbiont of Gigantopelta aegis TaxID=2794934 RepID=UPI0018DE0FB7|nr:TIGR04211 family SH3 domain-containing protein [sulfur-oxidizing endosymbiont of Gigantopelta aegis]